MQVDLCALTCELVLPLFRAPALAIFATSFPKFFMRTEKIKFSLGEVVFAPTPG